MAKSSQTKKKCHNIYSFKNSVATADDVNTKTDRAGKNRLKDVKKTF